MSKTPKKVRDKWRLKEWYAIFTPPYFGELNVANVPCDDPAKVIGRVVETTLYDITGDFSHQSIKLFFLVASVKGTRADTILKGHEYSADYLRSLVRRGSSRLDGIFNATSRDGFSTRVSIVAFARDRIKASQEHAIREVMRKAIEERARALNYDQLSHEMVLPVGGVGSTVYNEAKKINPIRHAGVRKSKLLAIPEGVLKAPVSGEAPVQEAAAEAA